MVVPFCQLNDVSVATLPAVEPVGLVEAKLHLRVDIDDDDSLITSLISAARESVEKQGSLTLISTGLVARTKAFASEMLLPRPPLISVDALKYVDADGVLQTLDANEYQVSNGSHPGRIWRAYGASWPATRDQPQAVQVEYTAGFGDAAEDVPAALRQAMLLLIGAWYEHREEIITGTIVSRLPAPAAAKHLISNWRSGWMW
jgi:uncharacterized phiE125 gp8 family phage protein